MDQLSINASEELKAIALVYMEHGKLDKAAEVMHLSEQIERRLQRNVVDVAQWQAEHDKKTERA